MYPFKALKKHMLKASAFTQDELLVVKNKETIDIPVMVTTYNPINPDIKGFIHNNWNIIKRPLRDACLCMGDLQAPLAPAGLHFVFLITL